MVVSMAFHTEKELFQRVNAFNAANSDFFSMIFVV